MFREHSGGTNDMDTIEYCHVSLRYQRVETRKREMFSQKSVRRFVGDSSAFVMIRHGRHVVSQCPKQKHFPPVLLNIFLIFPGGVNASVRALAKNMAPMTNADESPTNRLTLFPIYLSLFVVSTLWRYSWSGKQPLLSTMGYGNVGSQ